jgi:hypothetical protein
MLAEALSIELPRSPSVSNDCYCVAVADGVGRERPLSPQRHKRADWVVFNAVGGELRFRLLSRLRI